MAAACRDDEDAGDTSGKARAVNPRSTLSTAGVQSLLFGHIDLCAVSSSHDVVEKSPGPPLILVISDDDEDSELEVSSNRRPVRSASRND